MLKVKTGQSTKANAAEAGREAASYVKDEIEKICEWHSCTAECSMIRKS